MWPRTGNTAHSISTVPPKASARELEHFLNENLSLCSCLWSCDGRGQGVSCYSPMSFSLRSGRWGLTEDDWRWLKMIEADWRWLKLMLIEDDWRWLKMIEADADWRWLKMIEADWSWCWLKLIETDWSWCWLKSIEDDWNWLKLMLIEYHWRWWKLIGADWSWLKMHDDDWRWLKPMLIDDDWRWLKMIAWSWWYAYDSLNEHPCPVRFVSFWWPSFSWSLPLPPPSLHSITAYMSFPL